MLSSSENSPVRGTPTRSPSEENYYGVSGPDASDLLRALDAGQDISKFMSPDYIDKRIKKAKKLLGPEAEYRGLCVPMLPTGVQMAKQAQLGTAPSESFVKQWATSPDFRGSIRLIQTPTREKDDSRYKPEAGLKNLITVALTSSTLFPDRQIMVAFCQLPFDKFSPAQIRQVYVWLTAALQWRVTNGPLIGLYKRVISSVGRLKPHKLPDGLTGQGLKIRADVFGSLATLGLTDALSGVYLNLDSGAGFPWGTGKKRDHLKDIFFFAEKMLHAASMGKFVEYCSQHPTHLIWQLKNKLDLYEAAEGPLRVEPRAYFVTPSAFGVLASCIMHRVNKATVPFWEDPTSTSALGFTWMHGGGDRIHSWVTWCSKQKDGYYGICYGDDQLHCIVIRGSCYVSFLDAARFDLGLINQYGTSAYKYLTQLLGDRLDNTWRYLLQGLTRYAFATPVAVGYALVVILVNCLKSGIAGTTWFGMWASTLLIEFLNKELLQWLKVTPQPNEATVQCWFREMLPRMAAEMGIFIKKGTETLFKWSSDMDEYPGAFLGKTMVRLQASNKTWHYIPRSDPVKSMASMCSPKRKYGSGQQLRIAQLTRLRDIVVMGAFHYPSHMHVANAYWNIFTAGPAGGYKPGDSYEFEDSDDVLPPMFDFREKLPIDRVPTYDECVQLYMPIGVTYNVTPYGSAQPGMPEVLSAGAAIAALFAEDLSLPSGRVVDFATEEIVDRTNVLPSQPPSVDASHAGRVVPLPDEVKRKWLNALIEAREAAKQKAGKLKPSDKLARTKPGSKLAVYARLLHETAFQADYETAVTAGDAFWPEATPDDIDWDEISTEWGSAFPTDESIYDHDIPSDYYDSK